MPFEALAKDCDDSHPAVIHAQGLIKSWEEKLPDGEGEFQKFLTQTDSEVRALQEANAKNSGRIHLKIVYYYYPKDSKKYALWGYELSKGPSPLLNIKSVSGKHLSEEDKTVRAESQARLKANIIKCKKLSRSADKIKSCLARLSRAPSAKLADQNEKLINQKFANCKRKNNKADQDNCIKLATINAGFSRYSEIVWCALSVSGE